jgi:hypothetical protein
MGTDKVIDEMPTTRARGCADVRGGESRYFNVGGPMEEELTE